jgi:hypothetical protein
MVDDIIFGKMDLYSATSISKIYNNISKSNNEQLFDKPSEFIDLMLRIGQKLTENDYQRESNSTNQILSDRAKTLLLAPNLIDRMDSIQRKTTKDILIESEEDLLHYNLVIVSCKTQKPITYEVTGPSATGKTFPAEHAVAGFPQIMVADPAGVTGKAGKYDVDYIDDNGNRINKTGEKCFYFREKDDSLDAVKLFKQFMSHDKEQLTFQVTSKNMVTGENEAINYIMDGIPSFILLSTKHMDDEEMSTRNEKGAPTINENKTTRVVESKFESDTMTTSWKKPRYLDTLHNAMINLRKYQIVNIFADILKRIFPKDDMKRGRDADRLRGRIMACTVLHQYQRCYKQAGDDQLLYSSLEDNLIALILIDKTLESTILGIPQLSLNIFNIMKEMITEDISLTENNIHENIEAKGILMNMDTLKEVHLKTLHNHRFIRLSNTGGRGNRRSYIINDRYMKLFQVPKLTPLFIQELQKSYRKLINKHKDDFVNLNPPECKAPKNTINIESNHTNKIIKFLFGLHYFNKDITNSVMWKITDENIKDMLFNKHILNQSLIENKEHEEIEKNKVEVKREIISGESAKHWEFLDKLAKEHYEEEKKEMNR